MTVPGRRHVLLIIPTLAGGGAERVVVTLVRHLDRRRFRLSLAVVNFRNAAYRADIPADVEVIDLGCTRVRFAMPKIVRLIRRLRPNVVLSTLGHLNLALATVRSLLPDETRYVARETAVMSELLKEGGLSAALFRVGYRLFHRRFDAVVCQSEDMRNDLIHNFAVPPDRAVVINNPVDVAQVRQLAQGPSASSAEEGRQRTGSIDMVAVGRLVPQKGFDLLLQAVAHCQQPALRLTILGVGPARCELEALATKLGLTGQVRFAGFQTNPYPYLARADAFVLSSRFEGFPNVVLEALACGTPVIATPAPGGVREILNGVDGCFVAKAITAEALAEAMQAFLAQAQRVAPSPDSVERFSLASVIPRYEQLFAGA